MTANVDASSVHHSSHHLAGKIMTNSAAGAATLTPLDIFGNYLNTHGLWLLSWAEWIKVIGAIWVTILIIETCVKHGRVIYRKIKRIIKK
jgi:hypothetical protein